MRCWSSTITGSIESRRGTLHRVRWDDDATSSDEPVFSRRWKRRGHRRGERRDGVDRQGRGLRGDNVIAPRVDRVLSRRWVSDLCVLPAECGPTVFRSRGYLRRLQRLQHGRSLLRRAVDRRRHVHPHVLPDELHYRRASCSSLPDRCRMRSGRELQTGAMRSRARRRSVLRTTIFLRLTRATS